MKEKQKVILMCDLETWGASHNCVIRQIAIIPYLASTLEEVGERLILYPDECAQIAAGRSRDESTLKWWSLEMNKEVNDRIVYEQAWHSTDPMLAAGRVYNYMLRLKKDFELIFMARGAATFDYPILDNFVSQYVKQNLSIPFYRIWDLRSFTSIFELASGMSVVNKNRKGAHDALSDCEEQICQVRRAKHILSLSSS